MLSSSLLVKPSLMQQWRAVSCELFFVAVRILDCLNGCCSFEYATTCLAWYSLYHLSRNAGKQGEERMEQIKKQARRQSIGSKDKQTGVEEAGGKETSVEATPDTARNDGTTTEEDENAVATLNGTAPEAEEHNENKEEKDYVKKDAETNGAAAGVADTTPGMGGSGDEKEKDAQDSVNGEAVKEEEMEVVEVDVTKETDTSNADNMEVKKEEKPEEGAKPQKKADAKLQKVQVKLPLQVKRLALLDMYSGCGALSTGLEMGATPRGVTIETVSWLFWDR